MNQWESLVDRAKKAHANHCYTDAIKLNEYALLLSKKEFDNTFSSADPEKAVVSVIVSYLNIIDSHIAENRFATAHSLFEDIVSFLSDINSKPKKRASQHLSVVNGVKKLYIEWSLFLKDHENKLPSVGSTWIKTLPNLISQLSDENISIH
ncbi:MAG: hypothetical protein ACRBBR_00765 [Cellvibrionaceae bacterium]